MRMLEALDVHARITLEPFPKLPNDKEVNEWLGRANEARRRLTKADVYWLSSDMAKIVTHAAKTMPDEAFSPLDVPSPSGLILFQEPETLRDPAGVRGDFDCLGWFGTEHGCHVSVFNSSNKLHFIDSNFVRFGNDWCDVLRERISPIRKKFSEPEPSPHVFKAAHHYATLRMKRDGIDDKSDLTFIRLPKAFWILIEQTIFKTPAIGPDRAAKRRAVKLGREIPTIKLVTLRRVKYGDDVCGTKDVEWSHRWMVSSHWRNQWHPGKGMHRVRLILPYEKGPKDKPLVIKKTLNVVVR